jgi:hypothetical protein
MENSVTLEQVAALASKLSLQDKLKLMVQISQDLSTMSPAQWNTEAERQRKVDLAREAEFNRLCEEIAGEPTGPVDSAEEIRQIREERINQLLANCDGGHVEDQSGV